MVTVGLRIALSLEHCVEDLGCFGGNYVGGICGTVLVSVGTVLVSAWGREGMFGGWVGGVKGGERKRGG